MSSSYLTKHYIYLVPKCVYPVKHIDKHNHDPINAMESSVWP